LAAESEVLEEGSEESVEELEEQAPVPVPAVRVAALECLVEPEAVSLAADQAESVEPLAVSRVPWGTLVE